MLPDPKRSAFILIDPQVFILSLVQGSPTAAELVSRWAAFIRPYRAAGGTVVLTRVAFAPGFVDAVRTPVDAGMTLPEGGIPEAAQAYDPQVLDAGHDISVTKRNWSALYGTDLEIQLRRRGIDTLLFGGVATNFGVEGTVRDAYAMNYTNLVVEDLCASVSPEMHAFSIQRILPRLSRVVSSDAVLQGLQAAA